MLNRKIVKMLLNFILKLAKTKKNEKLQIINNFEKVRLSSTDIAIVLVGLDSSFRHRQARLGGRIETHRQR